MWRRKLVLDHDDFTHHILFIAGTGGGKSTFARRVILALNSKSLAGELPAAIIYLDPKGIDAPKVAAEVPELKNVRYIDPTLGFSFNPLALPPHSPEQRDQIVSLYIGHFRSLIESWYAKKDVVAFAPRMIWLFEAILRYLYKLTDEPTFGDIAAIAHLFLERDQARVNQFLKVINRDLRETLAGRELKTELQAIRELPKDAWFPILVRISRFATDPFLSKIFNVRCGSLNGLEMLDPNRLTVVRAAGVGEQILPLFIAAIVLGVWFGVRYRREISKKQNLVLVVGDELHTISEAMDLDQMLSQARAFDLGLFFLLQNLYHLPRGIRDSLLANAHTQMVSKVSGDDADALLSNWGVSSEDRQYFKHQMCAPLGWLAIIRTRDRDILEYDLPPPPEPVRGEDEVLSWARSNAPGFGEPAEPIVSEIEVRKFERWLLGPIPEELDWRILCSLREPGSFYAVCQRAGIPRTKETEKTWERLVRDRVLVFHDRTKGANRYKLSRASVKRYFEPYFSAIARSQEGQQIARAAFQHHLDRGNFVAVARQDVGLEAKPDLISYDYQDGSATDIEIESTSELRSHREQIAIHLRGFKEMGFDRCEVWFPKKFEAAMRQMFLENEDVEPRPVRA